MNVDKEEILNFETHAHEWWNVKGPYKILHKLNPLPVSYTHLTLPTNREV